MPAKILVADDDRLLRGLLQHKLAAAGFEVDIAEDGGTAYQLASTMQYALLVLDAMMPVMDGLAVQQALSDRGNKMPIIVLTGHGDVSVAVQAMKNGAIEFLEKPYEKKALLEAIETGFSRMADEEAQTGLKNEAVAKLTQLTTREAEVLDCLVDGMTNKAIADRLSISPRTVEIHRANLMEKLEADSLSAACLLYTSDAADE